MTMRSRSRYDSLALVKFDDNGIGPLPAIAETAPSHGGTLKTAPNPNKKSTKSPSPPPRNHLHLYKGGLTDFNGNGNIHKGGGKVNDQREGPRNPYEPLRLGSRQEETTRRLFTLKSEGIIVNDVRVLNTEPDVFRLDPVGSQSNVGYDLLSDHTGADANNSLERVWDHNKAVELDENSGRVPKSEDQGLEKGKSPEKRGSLAQGISSNTSEISAPQTLEVPHPTRHNDIVSIPFLQWDNSTPDGSSRKSYSIVQRVLDQVNIRLHNDTKRRKQYENPPLY
ncbi:hypothetical protein F5B20DRAFT_302478 [Whalleya microplaca]|nr:hypothetical protein F5B20DRAFT_302478 [Whalleya microplaca]